MSKINLAGKTKLPVKPPLCLKNIRKGKPVDENNYEKKN